MSSLDADVLVVGAGPAGVAAAVMAASLHLRTVVVKAGPVAGKLHIIGALSNVVGGWTTGPQLAQALAQDLVRAQDDDWCTVMHARAAGVRGHGHHAELVLDDGQVLTARSIVVATGVTATTPADVDWVSAPAELPAAPLWRATPDDATGRTYVLGGDRPLGTWLRAHPQATSTLHVLHPPADDYKVAEVADDDRVRLMPVSHVSVSRPSHGERWSVRATDRQGKETEYIATAVLNNLGVKPAALDGLVRGENGYCPPEKQHPRIRIAGDLRSARYQRIATAQGSGAEAVLTYYYDLALQGA